MATLLAKMDLQSEQLELLTRQQAERVDGLAQKQREINEHVSALEGDLESVKAVVDGRLTSVEESLTGLERLRADIGERHESLRGELHDELLRELSVVGGIGLGGTLRPTAPAFVCTAITCVMLVLVEI